jgi:hypothetical protein
MRLSPTESATLYKEGTKKKGNDGNIWIVSLTKINIKRWKKYKIISSSKLDKVNKVNKVNKDNKLVNILNVSTNDLWELSFRVKEENKSMKQLIPKNLILKVNYKLIENLPKVYEKNNEKDKEKIKSNAFLFGNLYLLNEYKLIGRSSLYDEVDTGLINLDLLDLTLDENYFSELYNKLTGLKSKSRGKQRGKSMSKVINKQIKKLYNFIIFIGRKGGNYDSIMYAHYNKNNIIDSILLDCGYFFPDNYNY